MMKTFILILVALSLSLSLKAQKYVGTKPQTPIRQARSIPKFLDSAKLVRDLNNLKALRDIYRQLEKKEVGMVYNYGFQINTLGGTTLSHPEKSPNMLSVNRYIETIFKNYKWIPAHKLDCKKCLLKSSGYFKVVFNTEQKEISANLGVVEENGSTVFFHVISMK